MKKINYFMAILAVSALSVACDSSEGTKQETAENQLYIDASDYEKWVYVDFETGKTETHDSFDDCYFSGDASVVAGTGDESTDVTIAWDLAFHRYEVRTNGGSAIETAYTEIEDVAEIPTAGYTADINITYEDNYSEGYYIIQDMSQMMSGSVGYAHNADYNTVLSKVVSRTGSMGSYVYSPSDYVYVVKGADGSITKIKWTSATSTTGDSGYVTIDYEHTYTVSND